VSWPTHNYPSFHSSFLLTICHYRELREFSVSKANVNSGSGCKTTRQNEVLPVISASERNFKGFP